MRIRCPECDFERDIDTTKIPATATVATCPRCTHRFRFRDPETGASVLEMEEAERAAQMGPGQENSVHHAHSEPAPVDGQTPQADIPPSPAAQDGDDPLPPGAIIPQIDISHEGLDADQAGDSLSRPTLGADQSVQTQNAPKQTANNGKLPPWLTPNRAKPSPDTPDSHGAQSPTDGVGSFEGIPWEHPERFGFLGSLLHTILRVMFRAPELFRQARSNAPINKAIVFFLLMSVMDVLIYRMWAINALQSLAETVSDPTALSPLQELVPSAGGDILMLLLFTPFIALFRLFFFAGLYHVMIRLVQPDKADFATVVRVIAYSSATYVLSLVPVVGSLLGSLWFVASTFIGCKFALNLSWSKITLALLPLFLLAGAVILQVSRVIMAGL